MTQPLAAATAIPENALEALFFFGTLLDRDILALVTGIAADELDLSSAAMPGFARFRVEGRSYPMVVRAPGMRVEGSVWRGATPRAIRRLNAYEGPEYGAELWMVLVRLGAPIPAWVYVATSAKILPSSEPWELAVWQARYKASFMARGEALVGSELP